MDYLWARVESTVQNEFVSNLCVEFSVLGCEKTGTQNNTNYLLHTYQILYIANLIKIASLILIYVSLLNRF